MIKAWSMSRLDVYESCPFRAFLQYVEKIPQPPLVCPPDKLEHPLIRGRRVHDAAEAYVTTNDELIKDLQSFEQAFIALRDIYRSRPASCIVEEEWAIDKNWRATEWNGELAWGRLKLDFASYIDTHMSLIDYKTGKKYPAKHIQQGQLYAIVCFERYPELETVETDFWYVDTGDRLTKSYSRIQALVLRDDFEQRALAMTTAEVFPAKPSSWGCRFCPYGEGRDGNKHCEHRYSF